MARKQIRRFVAGLLALPLVLVGCDEATAPPAPRPRVEIMGPAERSIVVDTVRVDMVLVDEAEVVSVAIRIGLGPERPVPIQPGPRVEASALVEIPEGEHRVTAIARNRAGGTAGAEIIVFREVLFDASLVAVPGVAPENVLSARVSYTAPDADSVRVVYWSDPDEPRTTPYAPTPADTATLLGLRPATAYEYRVEAMVDGRRRRSEIATFETADLPADLKTVRLTPVRGAPSRYALTAVNTGNGAYALAFDADGRIAWYRDFTDRGLPVTNAMPQPNGNLTAFFGGTTGWQPTHGYYLEFTPEGEVVRQYDPPNHYMDNHEIQLTGDPGAPTAHYFTYHIQTRDLRPIGGREAVRLAGHQVIRRNSAGVVEFNWEGWDRIGLEEWVGDEKSRAERTDTDYAHPNSLTFDPAGNYVVSWRNLNQVMAIHPITGEILWRVGGLRGEYEFVDDPWGGFSKQHAAHVLPNGNLLLYDNGSDVDPKESRAVEYELDHVARTATLVWEYRHTPAIYTEYVGYVRRLPNGNTWVAFSYGGRVVEVDAGGGVVWEGQLGLRGNDASAYRIVPIGSLDRPAFD